MRALATTAAVIALIAAGIDHADARKRHHKTKPRPEAAKVEPKIKPAYPTRMLTRAEILATDPERLARIGRHLVIGYHDYAAVKALVQRRAIAGVFITDHNVRGRPTDATAWLMAELQAIRSSQGLPPLIIAADQEGGTVSRLSPPLKRQPSLARILRGLKTDTEIETAVRAYARTQAAELKRIGVTLNFSPVVDLNINPAFRGDGETRLRMRAISNDPQTVAKVAEWYCDTLAEAGLMCTLKHFPGLGRAKRDTHVTSASIEASEDQLDSNDWVPFRRGMSKPNAVTMLGHVRVPAIDDVTPASFSLIVIRDLIRKKWNHDGLVITDDFSMGAVTRNQDGIGGAAIKALQAGADIILVSFSEKHLDTVMSALIEADAKGELDARLGDESYARLSRTVTRFNANALPAATTLAPGIKSADGPR